MNRWSCDVAPTSSCRTSVGVAVLDGYLYACGGQDGVSCLNYVERFVSILSKTKIATQSLLLDVSEFCLVAFSRI